MKPEACILLRRQAAVTASLSTAAITETSCFWLHLFALTPSPVTAIVQAVYAPTTLIVERLM